MDHLYQRINQEDGSQERFLFEIPQTYLKIEQSILSMREEFKSLPLMRLKKKEEKEKKRKKKLPLPCQPSSRVPTTPNPPFAISHADDVP